MGIVDSSCKILQGESRVLVDTHFFVLSPHQPVPDQEGHDPVRQGPVGRNIQNGRTIGVPDPGGHGNARTGERVHHNIVMADGSVVRRRDGKTGVSRHNRLEDVEIALEMETGTGIPETFQFLFDLRPDRLLVLETGLGFFHLHQGKTRRLHRRFHQGIGVEILAESRHVGNLDPTVSLSRRQRSEITRNSAHTSFLPEGVTSVPSPGGQPFHRPIWLASFGFGHFP